MAAGHSYGHLLIAAAVYRIRGRSSSSCRSFGFRSAVAGARELEAAAHAHQDVDELLAMFDRAQRQISEREVSRGCLSMFDVLHKRRESLAQNDRGRCQPAGRTWMKNSAGECVPARS